MSPIKNWMEEMCELLKHGGNLWEITIEVLLHYIGRVEQSDFMKIEHLLKPFEHLNGLKSAIVVPSLRIINLN
jgi:hypothetical protein